MALPIKVAVLMLFVLFAAASVESSDMFSNTPTSYEESDDVMKACTEAVCTLIVFVMAAFVVHAVKQRTPKKSPKKVKSKKGQAKQDEEIVASLSVNQSASRACKERIRQVAPDQRRQVVSERTARALNCPAAACTDTAEQQDAEREVLAAAVRAGRARELPWLLSLAREDAKACGLDSVALQERIAQQLLSALRCCAAYRFFREALVAFDSSSNYIGEGSGNIWSLLLYSAVETQEFDRCEYFFTKLLKLKTVDCNDFVNMVRFHASHRDVIGLKRTLGNLADIGFELDTFGRNRALSACTSSMALDLAEIIASDPNISMDTIGYNTLMKGCMHAGEATRCFEFYAKMQKAGIVASDTTFGILLDAYIDTKEIDGAKQLFEDLRRSGKCPNVVHYTTFIKGLAGSGLLEDAMKVLEEMHRSTSTKPDLITYSTLVKAFANHGRVLDAIRILEQMLNRGIIPDSIVFNTVLTGCTVHAMESRQVFYVFHWLLRHGLKTSTTTLSIMVKALAKTKSWDKALYMLEHSVEDFSIVPELRLYAQLAQACSYDSEFEKAAEVHVAMMRFANTNGIAIEESLNSRMQRICCSGQEGPSATRLCKSVARPRRCLESEVRPSARSKPLDRTAGKWR